MNDLKESVCMHSGEIRYISLMNSSYQNCKPNIFNSFFFRRCLKVLQDENCQVSKCYLTLV